MNDKVKHRIVGVLVIAIFLVVIVPVFIKNLALHTQKAEEPGMSPIAVVNTTVTPSAPSTPPVEVQRLEPEVFQSSRIAKVSLDHPAVPAQPLVHAVKAGEIRPLPQPQPQIVAAVQPVIQPIVQQQNKIIPTVPMPVPANTVTSVSAAAPVPVVVVKPVAAPVVPVVQKTAVAPVIAKLAPVSAPTTNTKNYCVQLGVFSDAANAQRLVNQLHAQSFPSAKAIAITLPNQKTAQRVTVCKAMSPAEAKLAKIQLEKLMHTHVILTEAK